MRRRMRRRMRVRMDRDEDEKIKSLEGPMGEEKNCFIYNYYYHYYYYVFWGKRREKLDEVAWGDRDDLWEGLWKQEGEKREERVDWVKVVYKGGGMRKEQVDWARSGFGGRRQKGGIGGGAICRI